MTDAHMVEPDEKLVTKTGKVLTDEEIQSLADEAERGYDVEALRAARDRALPPVDGDAGTPLYDTVVGEKDYDPLVVDEDGLAVRHQHEKDDD